MCTVITQHLNYTGQESKNPMCSSCLWHTCDHEARVRSSNMIRICRTLNKVIIIHSLKDLVFSSVREKANVSVFVKSENTSNISLEYTIKSKMAVYLRSGRRNSEPYKV